MSREDPKVSWPDYGALYLQSFIQDIFEELVHGFNYCSALDKCQVQKDTKNQRCSEVRMGRGFFTPRACTSIWGQT